MYGAWYGGASKLRGIRDKDGNVIVEASDASRQRSHTTIFGTRIDLTDDYDDPRRGARLAVTRSSSPPSNSGPDFSVMDYNMTAYLPIGRRNTWVFNYLRSDAVVSRQGETDPARIQDQMGINCSDPALTPQQQQYCTDAVNLVIAKIPPPRARRFRPSAFLFPGKIPRSAYPVLRHRIPLESHR
jgi:hypothetical protein